VRNWEQIVPEADREIYRQGGYGHPLPFGKRPALLLVDITLAFTGSRPLPIEKAIEEFPSSCGERAWKSLPDITRLLQVSRDIGVPIVYTTGDAAFNEAGVRTTKAIRSFSQSDFDPNGFVEAIAPRTGELVLRKASASAFFGTSLSTYLRRCDVDSILLAGASTSGCVRATAVDAMSHGFPIFPVEQCCFDRSEFSHLVNLFEINSRYGTVIDSGQAMKWLEGLPEDRGRNGAPGW
jgi:maleamate amidohydrolase